MHVFFTGSDGVYLVMRACAGPWHKLGTRYAQALVDDNTLKHRLRWLLARLCGDGIEAKALSVNSIVCLNLLTRIQRHLQNLLSIVTKYS